MPSSSDMKLNLILKATDGMSAVIKSACSQTDEAFEKTNKILEETAGKFDRAGKKAALFGGALIGLSIANVKMAGDFESGMNNVSTLIDTNVENLDDMKKKVLEIGKSSPKAISDLTDGLYSIRSAGIDAAKQFDVLKGSEMLAVAGLSTTAEAVDVTTSALNAFNLKGEEANKIYDMFFKVVKYGKTNISEFAQGFGSTAGVVAAANIKIDEYSAAVAAMTTSGLKAANAHTQIKAAIAGLSRGSKEQLAVFNKLGSKSFNDLVVKSGGMVNAFNQINKAVGGNQSKLIQLVGSVEGYNAILSLTGANNATYLKTLDDMRNGGDSLTEAYQKQTDGINNQMSLMKNNLQALGIEFGIALVPAVKAAGGAIKGLTDILSNMPDGLKSFFAITTAGIGIISLFGGTSLMVIGSLIKNLILFRNVIGVINVVCAANPIILIMTGAIALITALTAGVIYCYNHFEGFRAVCDGLWACIKAGGAWIATLVQNFISAATNCWNFIKPAVKIGTTILAWTNPIGLVVQELKILWHWFGKIIDKAGGWKVFGDKMKSWGESQEEKAEAVNGETKRNREANGVKPNGTHANGLDRVPFDGYIAEVHKDEAILTKPQADRWRNSSASVKSGSNYAEAQNISLDFKPTINITSDFSEKENVESKILAVLRQYSEELFGQFLDFLQRREARAY